VRDERVCEGVGGEEEDGGSDVINLILCPNYTCMHAGEVCPPGTFSSTNNAGTCTACDGVTGYSDEEGSTECLAIRIPCDPAEEIESKAPNPTQNRECITCGDGGTYNDASGLCKVATTCTPGQYVSKQVTLTTDRECGGACISHARTQIRLIMAGILHRRNWPAFHHTSHPPPPSPSQ